MGCEVNKLMTKMLTTKPQHTQIDDLTHTQTFKE